eukprot:TRINITY_DN277_c0_g2_i1.p1 TRINITY_DN277_c0_g2~~TRINITY_DN277_c0_g2_i1.p1  ORF type:complete len:311 (-),score=42.14 TRINITY_DN277_c0_g2_i1:36-968(-)
MRSLAILVVIFAHALGLRFPLIQESSPNAIKWRPVVLMHGINANNSTMIDPKTWIEEYFPGIYVRNVEIGNGFDDSSHLNLNIQVDMFAEQIMADKNLQYGFNLVGYSQGGLITRGYVERYNNPPVYNYITWSAPHGGVFGIPNEGISEEYRIMLEIVGALPYDYFVQWEFSFAGFWKDPYNLEDYLAYSSYLADINNERSQKNITYKKNIMSLNNFVMLYSEVDTIVIPKTSGWFEFFAPNSQEIVIPLNKSALYTEDWLGLQTLDKAGRLHFCTCSVPHQDYPSRKDVFDQFTLPYLNNTLPSGIMGI